MELIEEIKTKLDVEVREYSDEDEYFEAVVQAKDIEMLSDILKDSLGEPLKAPGENPKFPRHFSKLIALIGGIRADQSFYIKESDGGNFIFAALWPWQSDSSRVTLKMGWGILSEL